MEKTRNNSGFVATLIIGDVVVESVADWALGGQVLLLGGVAQRRWNDVGYSMLLLLRKRANGSEERSDQLRLGEI